MVEGVARVGRGAQRGRGAGGIGACTRDGARSGRRHVGGEGVVGGARLREGGGVGGVASHQHLVHGLARTVAPAHELIAAVRRGRQRGVVAVVVGTAARHRAAVARAGDHGDDILVLGEVGREVQVAVHRDGARVLRAVVAPVVEGVARVGHGMEGDDGARLVGARARDGACACGADAGRDGVVGGAHLAEDGGVGGVARDGEAARVLRVAVVPALELIAAVGRGRQRAVVAVVVGAAACDGACAGGADAGGDGVLQLREGGGVGGVAVDGDGARVAGAAVLPLAEGVAVVGYGLKGDAGAGRVGAAAGDRARTSWRHVGGDGVVGDGRLAEVGRVGGVLRDGEAIVRVGAHHGAVLLPAVELVAAGRRGVQRAGGARVVGAAAAHRAPGVVVRIDGDGVLRGGRLLEVGRVGGVLGDGEAVGGVGAHLGVAFLPVEELIAAGGCGREGAGGARVVGAAAAHRAAACGAGIGGDGVLRGGRLCDAKIVDVPDLATSIGCIIPKGNADCVTLV